MRAWVRTRLLSFGFILTLGFLLLVSLTISTGLANLRERFAERYAALVGLIGVLTAVLFDLYSLARSSRLASRAIMRSVRDSVSALLRGSCSLWSSAECGAGGKGATGNGAAAGVGCPQLVAGASSRRCLSLYRYEERSVPGQDAAA